jgi:hypothetical protein
MKTFETGETKRDLTSTVAVVGPADKYTTEELTKIVACAEKLDAQYDRLFPFRRGCNMTVFDKDAPDWWLRKRFSWYMGPMYSESLDEAIAFMLR